MRDVPNKVPCTLHKHQGGNNHAYYSESCAWHSISLLARQQTCPSWHDSKHVSFGMTADMSLLAWQQICPSWHDSKHVSFGTTANMSLLAWQQTCPSWHDSKYVSFGMTGYVTLLEWQKTYILGLFFQNFNIQSHQAIVHHLNTKLLLWYMVLLWQLWQVTCSHQFRVCW